MRNLSEKCTEQEVKKGIQDLKECLESRLWEIKTIDVEKNA
jgi:hypothetical protein